MDKHPIKEFRERNKLSQSDLARQIGVESLTVSRWERGLRVPKASLRVKIREVTGIEPVVFADLEARLREGAAA